MFAKWPALVGAALLLSFVAAARPSSAGDQIVLSQYGIAAITLPYAIALDRGYFKEQGLGHRRVHFEQRRRQFAFAT